MEGLDVYERLEQYLILLAGSKEGKLKELYAQKELFILSDIYPSLKPILNFKKHYLGPYSDIVRSTLEDPLYYDEALDYSEDGIRITNEGKKEFEKLSKEKELQQLVYVMRFVRNLYERLTSDELLFLIYSSYPGYTEKSIKSDQLFEKETKLNISRNLLKKKLITLERYEELVK